MEVSIDPEVSVWRLEEGVLIGFVREEEILKDGVFLIELYFILGVLEHSMRAALGSIVFSGYKVVPFLLIVEEVIDEVVVFDFGVLAVGVELNVFGECLDVGIVAAHDDSSMVIVLIDLNKVFDVIGSVFANGGWLVDDPAQLARRGLALDLQLHLSFRDIPDAAHVAEGFESACFRGGSRLKGDGDGVVLKFLFLVVCVFEEEDDGLILLDAGDIICGVPLIVTIEMISFNHGLVLIVLLLIGLLEVLPGHYQQDQ